MSSKRFTLETISHCYAIKDNFKGEVYYTDLRLLCGLLNSLSEKNEQLRSLLKDAEEEIETLKKSNQKLMESLVEHEAED